MGSNLGSKSPPKSRCQYPIFLDTKPQLVNIAKKGHLFQFDDHFESVLINGHKFQTNFGQWHSPIVFYVGGIEYRSNICASISQRLWLLSQAETIITGALTLYGNIHNVCFKKTWTNHNSDTTMNRNGNFGLVFGWGEILLTYMIFAYHWTS